jgi:DNA-binding beta-propeller fold protein YncE
VATSTVGATPRFMTIAKATHTLYVANQNSDSLTMINTATCNARRTTGCTATWPDVQVGHLPYGVRVDQRTQHLYIAERGDSTVREINTQHCRATDQSRCARTKIINAGGWSIIVTVDETTRTVYISDNVDAEVSLAHETRTRPRS